MKKSTYGKWSFGLTIVSLLLGTSFYVFLVNGSYLNFESSNSTLGYSAGSLLLVALVLSIISRVKNESGKWWVTPWVGLFISLLAFIIPILTVDFAS